MRTVVEGRTPTKNNLVVEGCIIWPVWIALGLFYGEYASG